MKNYNCIQTNFIKLIFIIFLCICSIIIYTIYSKNKQIDKEISNIVKNFNNNKTIICPYKDNNIITINKINYDLIKYKDSYDNYIIVNYKTKKYIKLSKYNLKKCWIKNNYNWFLGICLKGKLYLIFLAFPTLWYIIPELITIYIKYIF